MKIGVSELIPIEKSDDEVGKKAKKSTKPKNPPNAALGRKPHEDSEQKSCDFGLWDDHDDDDDVDDQELSLVSSQQVPSNQPTSASATPESLTSPTSEKDETDASGTDTISKKIAKLEQDRKIMEAKYTKQKKTIQKKTDKITYLNEKLAQRQKYKEKEHHKKKRRKTSIADPRSSHGKRAYNRKQIVKQLNEGILGMMEEQISRLEKLQHESESAKSRHKKKLSTATAAKFEHMFNTDDEEELKLSIPEKMPPIQSLQKPTTQVPALEITPGVSQELMHQDDISARVKKSVVQYWIDELTQHYFQYYSSRTPEKKISLDFLVSQLKANMTDEQTETARYIFASDILSNIYHKLNEGYRAITIEYVKEMEFSLKRQKMISVYKFICPHDKESAHN